MAEQARLIRLPDGTRVWARLSPAGVAPPGRDGPAGPDEAADGYDDGCADDGGGGAGYDDGYGGYQDVGALDRAADRVLRLRELITGVAASVRDAAQRAAPDEVSVEFGVEFAVRGGAIVSVLADAEATSGLKVTLTWHDGLRRERPADAGPPSAAPAVRPAQVPAPGSDPDAAPAAPAAVPPPAGGGPAR